MYIKQIYSWTWSSLNNKKLWGNLFSYIKNFFFSYISSCHFNQSVIFTFFSVFFSLSLCCSDLVNLTVYNQVHHQIRSKRTDWEKIPFRFWCTFIIIKTVSKVPDKSFTGKKWHILFQNCPFYRVVVKTERRFHSRADLSSTGLNFGPQRSWTQICGRKQKERLKSIKLDQSGSKWIKVELAGRLELSAPVRVTAYMSWCLWIMWLLYSSTGGMDSSSSGT